MNQEKETANNIPKIPAFIKNSEIAKRMGFSNGWLAQRLNGYIVSGKPATFKPEEIERLRSVLVVMWKEFGEEIGIKS